jgi:hypothetical protein
MERVAYKVIPMRASAILVLLALLMSSVFSYQLAVKVTVAGETLAVGTNVSIMTGGVELYTQRVGNDGYVKFNVSQGSYFLLLRRGGYPLQVSIIDVDGNTNVSRTIWQTTSYASAYGQISGPDDFTGSTVTAFANGLVVKKTEPNQNGFYIMTFLPEGTYQLQFSAPGHDNGTAESFLAGGDYTQVNSALQKTPVPTEPSLSLSVPQMAEQQSLIAVFLAKGSLPLAGEKIDVRTPSGAATITTGQDGKAYINAVDSGSYVFTYKNLTYSTVVPPKEQPKQNVSTPVIPAPQNQSPPAPAPEEKPDYTALAVVALVLLGMVLLGGALFSGWYMLFGRKQHKEHHSRHAHHEEHGKK